MSDEEIFDVARAKAPIAKLPGKYKRAWVEESTELTPSRQIPADGAAVRRNFLGASISERAIRRLFLLIIIGVIIIFGRVIYLQIWRGEYYRALAEGNRIRLRPIVAERGIIYDREKRELVQNVPNFSLSVIPQDLPRDQKSRAAKQGALDKIAALSGMTGAQIDDIFKKYHSSYFEILTVKDNLDYEAALRLYIQNTDMPGIAIEKGSKRRYLSDGGSGASGEGDSLAHVLGYLGKIDDTQLAALRERGYLLSDNIGKTGLEKIYEEQLRGNYGRRKIEVNALGKELNVLAEEPPTPGKNLFLTLDAEAQLELERITRALLERIGKRRAAAIALDPRDGGILALVSLPTFDNNKFAGGISAETYNGYLNDADQPLFNRAVSGAYPSGSTVKPVVAAAALQEKIIDSAKSFMSVGGLQVGDWFFRDWKEGGHGATNVGKALAWSVNTFFYYIGGGYGNFVGLGADKIAHYMRQFNLGAPTSIDLPSESAGFIPTREWKEEEMGERWYVGDTYNLSIGQGQLLVTPLQAAVWTAAIANGGQIIQPHLGDKLVDALSKTEIVLPHAVRNQGFISSATAATVKRGMRQCVIDGSCGLLASLPFAAAGKTGTAQWSQSRDNHAWFTAFAPYDEPRVVITVLVEEGKEGAAAAMPIARDWLRWWGKKYLK